MIRLARGLQKGTSYDDVTRSIDVFPTIAGLSGLLWTGMNKADGEDLSGAILGTKKPPNLVAFSCNGLPHPAVGRDDPHTLLVQAREGDEFYRLTPIGEGSRLRVFHLSESWDKKDLFDPKNDKHGKMEKQLRDYRDRLIRDYHRSTDESNWGDVRERLRSLGYLNQ
jgi:hypothetical protein